MRISNRRAALQSSLCSVAHRQYTALPFVLSHLAASFFALIISPHFSASSKAWHVESIPSQTFSQSARHPASHPFVHRSIHLSIYPASWPAGQPASQSVCLSVCRSVFVGTSGCTYGCSRLVRAMSSGGGNTTNSTKHTNGTLACDKDAIDVNRTPMHRSTTSTRCCLFFNARLR